jgi:hypothetical protein
MAEFLKHTIIFKIIYFYLKLNIFIIAKPSLTIGRAQESYQEGICKKDV